MRFMLLIALLLLPGLACAQSEDSDRGFIQGLLEDGLSGPGRTVRMTGFAGALSSRATIDQITVSDPEGVWLTMDDVAMTWNRSALLRGAIEIEEISVEQISLPRLPVAEEGLPEAEARGTFSLPDLPVSIRLDTLALRDVSLGQPIIGEAVELSVDGSASLTGGSGEAELTIERRDRPGAISLSGKYQAGSEALALALSLEEPEGGIAARLLGLPGVPSVNLEVEGEGPIDDFAADIRLDTDGRERLAGDVTLTGMEDGGRGFAAQIGGDLAPVLAPQYRSFLGRNVALRAEGVRSADGAFRLDLFDLTAAALSLSGRAEINAEGWPDAFSVQGRIVPPEGDRVILPVPGEEISLSGAQLSATYDKSDGEGWQAQIEARDLLRGGDRLDRLALNGTGNLSQDRAEMRGTLRFDARGIAPQDAALARAIGADIDGKALFDWWRGDALFLRDLELRGADYGLTGKVEIARSEEGVDLDLRPDLMLSAADLSRFAPLAGQDLAGAANLSVKGQVQPVSGRADLTFDGMTRDLRTGIAQLDPLLAGEATLFLTVARDETGLRADPVRIESDEARITATANLRSEGSRAQASLTLNDLSKVVPELGGPAQADITLAQRAAQWDVTARAQGPGATQVLFDGTVDTTDMESLIASGQVEATLGRLDAFSRLAGQPLGGSARFTGQGRANLAEQSFDVSASGRTTNLRLGASPVASLLAGTVAFDGDVARSADGTTRIEALTLDGPNLNGRLSGAFDTSDGNLTFRVSIPDLAVVTSRFPGPARLDGTARLSGDRWRIDAQGTGPAGINASVNGSVFPNGPRLDLALSGTAPLTLANPDLAGQDLSGLARFDLAVIGPPALTSVSGTVRTENARLSLPDRGIVLAPITGRAVLSNGRAEVDLTAPVNTGGRIELRGPVSLSPPFNADLRARLRNLTVREEDLLEADLEGELSLRGGLASNARIGGDIILTTVEMRIPNLGPSYASLDGLRHEDLPSDVRQTLEFADLLGASQSRGGTSGPAYPLNLTVSAPSRLFVRGRGLDAELGGSVTLRGTTANVVPQGRFELIRGRLDLLGRRLTLTEGSVWLRGSFDPVIRFAATTQVDDVAITLLIEGEASAPKLTVESSPDLPEDEALSLFLFGRDPTRISALQALQLAAAIRTLSGQGSLGISNTLRQNLGVSDLDVGTDAEGNAQARVGTYLSERVYTDVTLNSEGDNQIRLNFDVSPNVTIRGRVTSDGETGLGVFFERDY